MVQDPVFWKMMMSLQLFGSNAANVLFGSIHTVSVLVTKPRERFEKWTLFAKAAKKLHLRWIKTCEKFAIAVTVVTMVCYQ